MPRKALAAAALLAAAAAVLFAARRGGSSYSLAEGRFSLRVPPGWTVTRDAAEDSREKIFGASLRAPGGSPASSVVVEYYAPGNLYFASGKDYLARQSGAPESFALSGRPAWRWRSLSGAPGAPRTLLGEVIPLRTERILIGEGPAFHLVVFSCPESDCPAREPEFRRLLDGLRVRGP